MRVLVVGESGSGKSVFVAGLARSLAQADFKIFCFDTATKATSWTIYKHIDNATFDDLDDNNKLVPVELLAPSDNPKIAARRIQSFLEAVAASRGLRNTEIHPQLFYYARWWCKAVMGMEQRVPLHFALSLFRRDTDEWRWLLTNCQNEEARRFFLTLTKQQLLYAPTVRMLEVVDGVTFRAYDQPGWEVNLDKHYLMQYGANCTAVEGRLITHMRIQQLIEYKISTQDMTPVVIIIEEANVVGLSPSFIQWVVLTGRKLNLHCIIVCQNDTFESVDAFDARAMVLQNTDKVIFRCEYEVAARLGRFLGIDGTQTVKQRTFHLRDRLIGFQEYEAKTEGDHGESVSQRFMPIKQPYWEKRDTFYTPQETDHLVALKIMGQAVGEATCRSEGRTRKCRFPMIEPARSDQEAMARYEAQELWTPISFNATHLLQSTMQPSMDAQGNMPNESANPYWTVERQALLDYLGEAE